MTNPLQKSFRQPKIYITLPSKGIYNKPNTFKGDINNMPVYSMTGMDEIISKTPDALFTGESTIKIIESCCPFIIDANEISSLDIDTILTAIKIATFGNYLEVHNECKECKSLNNYDIEMNSYIDEFSKFKFNNKLITNDLVINFVPLNYREKTILSIENFEIQKKLSQINVIVDEIEKQNLVNELFNELGKLTKQLMSFSIDSVVIGTEVVDNKEYINEWIDNIEMVLFNDIKKHIESNNITIPPIKLKCEECGNESESSLDLDYSSFFVKA